MATSFDDCFDSFRLSLIFLDKAREKARLVEIFKNEVDLSKRFASLGDMAWFHRRLAESIAAYLDLWK